MAAASMDALGAFTHLHTNLPAWITRVSELAAHTSAKHAEYSEAYRQRTTHKPRRRKNSSVCSIHTNNLVPIAQQKAPSSEPVQVTTSMCKEEKAPTQQAGRKRGTEEAPSIDSSDRYEFVSTRYNVIIDYDGHTQQELEQIVKDIGIARNNIRRGKMSLMPPRIGLRTNLLNRSAAGAGGADQPSIASLACVRSTRTATGLVGVTGTSNGVSKDSPFDFCDKQLELAHGLCETAAFQVLRSGDCGTELDGVEEKFKMLLEMTKNEVTRLEEEKKKQQEQGTQQETEEGKDEAKPLPTSAAARLARISALSANKQITACATGTIEVDDDSSLSAESLELDLSAFRSSRIRV
ncbi:hypothetical protein N7520_011400 [Penicillium odoratum]|uniref:uncharacterized protein n=1 Tax=Penicillium odoratum TaxID=1167516 RepID=UPI002546F566|nr:uncharacterized protein N7520_011400 [Penicillium odoratum]KAJ5746218.1 hypothetical protein N7520_011400 [Penicillium odoratum]